MLSSYIRRKEWEHKSLAQHIAVAVGKAFFGSPDSSASPARDTRNAQSSPEALMAMVDSRFVA